MCANEFKSVHMCVCFKALACVSKFVCVFIYEKLKNMNNIKEYELTKNKKKNQQNMLKCKRGKKYALKYHFHTFVK